MYESPHVYLGSIARGIPKRTQVLTSTYSSLQVVAIATPVTAKDMKFDVKKRDEMKCPAVDVWGDRLVKGFSGDDKIIRIVNMNVLILEVPLSPRAQFSGFLSRHA